MAGGGRAGAKTAVVAALAVGVTVADAARDCGVGESTVYRWKREAGFQAEIAQLRREMLDRAVGGLVDAATEAAQTLRDMLGAGDEAVRVRAAKEILASALRYREHAELEERVARLEGRAAGGA